MKETGIYKIVNKKNGMIYIGSTVKNFVDRWNEHKSSLRNRKHRNKKLQNDWNLHGEESFDFQIIEKVEDKNVILEKEDVYIKEAVKDGKCYNAAPYAVKGGGRKVDGIGLGDTTQKRRQDKRKAEMQEAALRDGFEDKIIRGRTIKAWSQAITAWKNGEYVLVKSD